MKFAFVLLIFLFESAYAGNGIFVGNGGDGVMVGDRLIMKDLYMGEAYLAPYFGPTIDPNLPPLPSEDVIGFDYPKELLARKLTDLNEALPGLGDYVLATIKVFKWRAQDLPLARIEDPEEMSIFPQHVKQIQIANRFQTLIRVNRQAYFQLNEENRVALIIHEAIFSLTSTTPMANGRAYQSAHIARDIVGSFFHEDFFRNPPTSLQSHLQTNLMIPNSFVQLGDIRRPKKWRIYAAKHSMDTNWYHEKSWEYPAEASNRRDAEATVRFICNQTRNILAGDFKHVRIDLDGRPVALSIESYLPPGDPAVPQINVRIDAMTVATYLYSFRNENSQDCENRIGDIDFLVNQPYWK